MPRPGLKLKDYQEFAQSRGYRYIADDIPKNTCTRIEGWECENGHVANISYSNFGSRKTCPSCKGRQRKVIQDYINIAISRGGKYLHNTIPAHTNDSARDAWQCSKGHVWSSSFTHISSSGTWCPECALDESRRTLEDYRTLAGKLGLAFIDKERPTSVSASCNWQCLVHPDKIISTSYHLLDNLSYHSPCNICQGDYSSTINFGVPSIEEAKSILKNIDTLREYDCKAVLFRLGGKTTLPEKNYVPVLKSHCKK